MRATATDFNDGENLGIAEEDVVHWYDFICPFCYVGQQRSELLEASGLKVVDLPFRAHPEIPKGGTFMGPRSGPMYDMLNKEAERADLPLHWPDRLPNTELALACAEWIREHSPEAFRQFEREVFAAHFARHQDIGDPGVIDEYAAKAGADVSAMHTAIADGTAREVIRISERFGVSKGVQGTPAWLVGGRLISGLRSISDFEQIAKQEIAQEKRVTSTSRGVAH